MFVFITLRSIDKFVILKYRSNLLHQPLSIAQFLPFSPCVTCKWLYIPSVVCIINFPPNLWTMTVIKSCDVNRCRIVYLIHTCVWWKRFKTNFPLFNFILFFLESSAGTSTKCGIWRKSRFNRILKSFWKTKNSIQPFNNHTVQIKEKRSIWEESIIRYIVQNISTYGMSDFYKSIFSCISISIAQFCK